MTERASGWRWTLAAAIAGLAASGIFSGVLDWTRSAFIGAWLLVSLLVLGWYWRVGGIDLFPLFRQRWVAGLVVGAVFGAIAALTVLRQPQSPRPEGAALIGANLWWGAVYGTIDALMMSVLPVLSLYEAPLAARAVVRGRRVRSAAALLASVIVTAAYHVGFREFRSSALAEPVIGNVLMTIAYLIAGNPLAAIIGHVVMHLAAVVHGAATTAQLPPHY